MTYSKDNGKYLIRLMPDEELVESLTTFCKEHNISGGTIIGLGAAKEVELGFFSVDTKEYKKKTFTGEFEVSNLTGNISAEKLHIHMTIGDENFQAFAGHCNRAIANPTLEVMISPYQETHRTHDDYSGLQLLELDETT
ncbi:MAG: DNA-binding protein [bacterium]|nr:DNA-binding protein [bacterium]